MFATRRAPCHYGWTGIGQHGDATQTDRAISIAVRAQGPFRRARRQRLLGVASGDADQRLRDAVPRERQQKALGLDGLPLGPPTHGWITGARLLARDHRWRALSRARPDQFRRNFVVSQPRSARLGRRRSRARILGPLRRCSYPTAQYADIVLPVTRRGSAKALRVGFEISPKRRSAFNCAKRLSSRSARESSDSWIAAELAKRLGFGALFRDGDFDAAWNDMLEPLGITTRICARSPKASDLPLDHRFRKYADEKDGKVRGFNTPTRRVELYSEQLLRARLSTVAAAAPGPSVTGHASAFRITLTTAKNGHFCHSQQRGITCLRRRSPAPQVDLSPVLAASRRHRRGRRGRNSHRAWAVTCSALHARCSIRRSMSPSPDYGWWQGCADLGLPGYQVLGADDASLQFADRPI